MPAWADELTPEELMSVVVYERAEFGGLDPVEEGLIDEEGNLLVVYDPGDRRARRRSRRGLRPDGAGR